MTPLQNSWMTEDSNDHREKLVVDRVMTYLSTVKGTIHDYEYDVKWEVNPSTWTA